MAELEHARALREGLGEDTVDVLEGIAHGDTEHPADLLVVLAAEPSNGSLRNAP